MHNKILSLSHKRHLHANQTPLSELIKEVIEAQELRNIKRDIFEDAETMAILRNEVYLDNKYLIEVTSDYMNAVDEFDRAIKKVLAFKFVEIYTKEVEEEIQFLESI